PTPPPLYTLSLHDALPISRVPPLRLARASLSARGSLTTTTGIIARSGSIDNRPVPAAIGALPFRRNKTKPSPALGSARNGVRRRSEEHTSELQSPCNLVCR